MRNIIFYSLFIIDQTFELLLFSIALEKCLCTFFPKLEPYFTSARNSLLDKIWALYIVHVIKELSILVVVRRTVGNGKAKDTVGYVHGVSTTLVPVPRRRQPGKTFLHYFLFCCFFQAILVFYKTFILCLFSSFLSFF